MKKKPEFEIGQEVFIIDKDVNIIEKNVIAVINMKNGIGYTLDENSCGGYSDSDVFATENKAKVAKQNFLDELRFKVGDLIIFKHKEYNREEIVIGKIKKISFRSDPYYVTTRSHTVDNLDESQIILKVKNKYIENYGRMKDLMKEFEDQKKVMGNILKKIGWEHDELEAELKQNFKKQLPTWYDKRDKPLFKDCFNYEREDYYD